MPELTESAIEELIKARGANGLRVTPEIVDMVIESEAYHRFPETTVTVCCLTLRNGYHVIGQSAAADPRNFDEEIGRKIARADARDKIWALEGYLLREIITAHEHGM